MTIGASIAVAAALVLPGVLSGAEGLPGGWSVSFEGGGQGSLSAVDQGFLVGKTNGFGSMILTRTDVLPVEAGRQYEAAVHLRLTRRAFNASVFFHNEEIGSGGGAAGGPYQSASFQRIPNFLAGGARERHWIRWTAAAGAVSVRIAFRIQGGPIAFALDGFEFIPSPPSLDQAGAKDSGEPLYDEAAALRHLAERKAEPARVIMAGQRPLLAVGENFRDIVSHQTAGRAPGRYAGFARAGIHLQSVRFAIAPLVEKPDGFDFGGLRRQILEAVAADAEVRVILRLGCNMPPSWLEAHPGDVWTAENGEKWILWRGSPNRTGHRLVEEESFAASYGSPRYREDAGRALEALGRFLRDSDAGRVVAGAAFTGGNDGQFYDNSQVFASYASNRKGTQVPAGVQLDHSRGHAEGFREWLREIYRGDVGALREAWGDTAVTFETATVSPEAERIPKEAVLGRGERRAIDSNRYAHIAPARLVKSFSQRLEKAAGRPLLSMTYYPDVAEGALLNKFALGELLSGPDRLDAAAAVQGYGYWRKLGSTGATFGSWGSYRLRGALQICEIDYRTYRSPWEGFWSRGELGAPETAEGFRAQIRRDIGATASRGMGAWFYDIRGGMYDDAALWDVIAEAKRILDWSRRPEAPSPVARVAVFADEDAARRIGRRHGGMISGGAMQRRALNMSGVPYDMYLLDDIRHPRLPDYRVYIFASALALEREHIEAIERRCRQPGKVTVFSGHVGLASLDGDRRRIAERVTGIRVAPLPEGTPLASAPVAGVKDPIAAGLTEAFHVGGSADRYTLAPDDPEAVVFGRYVCAGRPSHVLKRTPRGISILTPPFSGGWLTPELLHNLARAAGIGLLGTPGNVTYAGSGVAVCHRVQPGPATVHFGEPVDLIAPDGKTLLARRVTRWEPQCGLLGTDLVFYRPASGAKETAR